MRHPLHLTLCTALFLTTIAPRPATPAEKGPFKPKTQVVTVKVHKDSAFYGKTEIPIDFVRLPSGKIILHDNAGKPVEHVIKPIWMARFETRWDEYNVFWMQLDRSREQIKHPEDTPPALRDTRIRKPYMPPYAVTNGDHFDFSFGYPADCIHFQAAQRYCAWLSLHTGKRFRLPTEAEWEWACRAGGRRLKPDAKTLDTLAWFADNADDQPHPVGQKQPNPWGLYDMLGNVAEYVIRDPKDDKGLTAGGSFKDDADHVGSAAREPYSPAWQKNDPEDPRDTSWLFWSTHHVGFRVVMED